MSTQSLRCARENWGDPRAVQSAHRLAGLLDAIGRLGHPMPLRRQERRPTTLSLRRAMEAMLIRVHRLDDEIARPREYTPAPRGCAKMQHIHRWRSTVGAVLFASALAATAATTLDGCSMSREAPARAGETRSASTASGPAGPVHRRAALEVSATFWVPVASSERATSLARTLVDFADAHEGFAQSSSVGQSHGARVVLRVPPREIGTLRTTLARAAHGGPLREEITSTDVTDALADLDARLRAERATEIRLLALLEQRTGTLADVVAVERALADTRGRVEQIEATQRGAQGRVDLATVTVDITTETSVLTTPLGRQAAEAFRDGMTAARGTVVTLLVMVLRALPVVLVFALPGAALWFIVNKFRRR
jgi:hypothetical protein